MSENSKQTALELTGEQMAARYLEVSRLMSDEGKREYLAEYFIYYARAASAVAYERMAQECEAIAKTYPPGDLALLCRDCIRAEATEDPHRALAATGKPGDDDA